MRLTLVVALCASSSTFAQTATDIAASARERGGLNLLNLQAQVRLVTSPKDGAPKEQVVTSASRKVEGRSRSIVRFVTPASVAGVAVLTIEGPGTEPGEASIYLPKLKRVRKVAQAERGQAFMGTDFNYADLGGMGGSDQRMKRLADGEVDGRATYVIQGPADPSSPYGEVTLYVDKETYVPLRVDYQDREGKAYKRYHALALKKFKDRTVAARATMENLQTGSATTLEVQKLEDSSLGDEAFSERALERG